MGKERVVVFIEPALLRKVKSLFSGSTESHAISQAVEYYLETKDYVDWAIRTAVISRATMEMLAQLFAPGDVDKQQEFMLNCLAKADKWVKRRLMEDGQDDRSSSSV